MIIACEHDALQTPRIKHIVFGAVFIHRGFQEGMVNVLPLPNVYHGKEAWSVVRNGFQSLRNIRATLPRDYVVLLTSEFSNGRIRYWSLPMVICSAALQSPDVIVGT